MNKFASLSAADRAVVLRETAVRTGIGSPAVVEKDFWVCWTLGQIFRSRFISAKKILEFDVGTSPRNSYE
jgi:hypothetical protein